ncbi:MAG: phosphohistidine phosphatase SixA [Gammaproteobacteria bacterium]|nr:MAG: phosphohistidine phosphatase SixA [Gammaproteobacteria bacterium]
MNRVQKTVYLVRHAKSSWGEPGLADMERPLNKRGSSDCQEMGSRLNRRGLIPDLIVSSPALRAVTTAQCIARQLQYPEADIVEEEAMYCSGTDALNAVLQRLDERFSTVMLVGHNPDMTGLVNMLCGPVVDDMPTCAIATVGLDIENWSEIDTGTGELADYDFPKKTST